MTQRGKYFLQILVPTEFMALPEMFSTQLVESFGEDFIFVLYDFVVGR